MPIGSLTSDLGVLVRSLVLDLAQIQPNPKLTQFLKFVYKSYPNFHQNQSGFGLESLYLIQKSKLLNFFFSGQHNG